MKNNSKSRNKYIIIILISCIVGIFSLSAYSFADVSSDAESFLQASQEGTGGTGGTVGDTTEMQSAILDISGLLMGLGIIVSVIVAAVLGIQFIMGGAEEQAKIKESIIPYVCGCAVIFGASIIWKVVVTILNQAT